MSGPPSRIGVYPIERELGRGGMGIVYLGRDTRLQRAVAIKVLPDAFAHDPERLSRFEREARLLASLNHPNIAGIYGLEEAAGHRSLAREYVAGETLAARIDPGPLPLEDGLPIARQIAEALEAAHESGVIHRDLKPGNIKLTPAGDVKVLDFGLAKGAADASSSGPNLSQSPTLTYSPTGVGVILGTAAYMSPEQARGKPVDRRTDIWSFGCVLYEMLTGRQLFSGETVSDMIAKILEREPDWSKLPTDTPPRVRELLRRCLDKDPKQRLRDVGEARLELSTAIAERSSGSSAAGAKAAATTTARSKAAGAGIAWLIAVAALALAAVAMLAPWARQTPKRGVARFTITAPPGYAIVEDAMMGVISPDGRTVAFAAVDSAGTSYLCVRPIDALAARLIPGTDNTEVPFWSPDSRFIGFFADGKLRRVPAAGGDVEVVCDARNGRGGAWNRDDVIVFAAGGAGPLFKVPASGGTPQPITTLDSTRHETAHRFPLFLPDGKRFLFTSLPARARGFDVWLGSLDSPKRQLVMTTFESPAYLPTGQFLYQKGRGLAAQRFDVGRGRLVGESLTFPDFPAPSQYGGARAASASDAGDLVYVTGRERNTQLEWFDRSGHRTGVLGMPPGRYTQAVLSPDGRQAAVVRESAPNSSELWLVDIARDVASRLTFGPGYINTAIWAPDGRRIAFSTGIGSTSFVLKSVEGASAETLLFSNNSIKNLDGWSSDGRYITFEQLDEHTGWDLYVLPVDRSGPPRPYLNGPFNEGGGVISPDGRWILHNSDESGTSEIYVESFPNPGSKYRVTTNGGGLAAWRKDGREIVMTSPDFRSVLACDVIVAPTFPPPPPHLRFRFPEGSLAGTSMTSFERFLLPVQEGDSSPPTITVALDWASQLEKR